jgi:CO/xanthine dehydrogenase Mo-binding subunit
MTAQQALITRRGFTFGISALAGGLVIGARMDGASAQERPESAAVPPELTAWVVIEPDDTVVIRVARSDMGQGVFTALPMLVAEELECDWARVRPEYASPAEHVARKRVWGNMVTTDSVSVRTSQDFLRKAGAQARTMLLSEAAARWNCPIEECTAKNSVVTHVATGRRLRYGALAEAASRRPVPANVVLKPSKDWKLIGTSVHQFDTRAKVTGQLVYAIDVRLPGMLHAAVSACPALNGKLKSFDPAKVLGMPGVRHVVPVGDSAVAVVATTWWQAKTALEALQVTWDESAGAGLSTDAIRKTLQQGLDATDVAVGQRIGDIEAAMASAARVLTADYEVPYLAHATMEPQTCTAHVVDGRAEVWAPTQNGEGTLGVVAKTLDIDPSKVIVHKCHLGGGFGRRGLSQDWARQAVLIAKAVGQPVKMIWTRQEDITHGLLPPDGGRTAQCGLRRGRQAAGMESTRLRRIDRREPGAPMDAQRARHRDDERLPEGRHALRASELRSELCHAQQRDSGRLLARRELLAEQLLSRVFPRRDSPCQRARPLSFPSPTSRASSALAGRARRGCTSCELGARACRRSPRHRRGRVRRCGMRAGRRAFRQRRWRRQGAPRGVRPRSGARRASGRCHRADGRLHPAGDWRGADR